MSAKHSPGPWREVVECPRRVRAADGRFICDVSEDDLEQRPNTRLIEKAPELLARLKKQRCSCPYDDCAECTADKELIRYIDGE